MTLTRRAFIKAGAMGAGGMLLARPALGALAGPLGPAPLTTTSRASRLFEGTLLAHADLHNHSLLSDGDGDAANAFASMRNAGLDIAALTDHSTLSWGLPSTPCMGNTDCQSLAGINEGSWEQTRALADLANEDGSFVALRGFEWSSPTIGHMNVWFSERWMDPLHTGGGGSGEGAAQFAHDEGNFPAEQLAVLDALVKQAPTTGAGMASFYAWLTQSPGTPGIGGGADGLASFNHPGREPGRFSHFKLVPGLDAVRDRVVAIEMFNRREDYLFEGTDSFAQSPLNECLNAGWRVGISGVTDEHSDDWAAERHVGKGRTGLWLTELSRAGVREALAARRFFATREAGLRVDARANGTRMGSTLAHSSGPITFQIDIDKGAEWLGKELLVQVLRSGSQMPAVQANVPVVVPTLEEDVISFTLDLDRADGDWVVLRISDPNTPVPSGGADGNADATWQGYGKGMAYCSPFFLE